MYFDSEYEAVTKRNDGPLSFAVSLDIQLINVAGCMVANKATDFLKMQMNKTIATV